MFLFQICPHLMWQTSFYLFGSFGIVWSVLWISLYSEKDYGKNDELPLVMIPQVIYTIINILQTLLDFKREYPLLAHCD